MKCLKCKKVVLEDSPWNRVVQLVRCEDCKLRIVARDIAKSRKRSLPPPEPPEPIEDPVLGRRIALATNPDQSELFIPTLVDSRLAKGARELGLHNAADYIKASSISPCKKCGKPATTPSGKRSRLGLCQVHAAEYRSQRSTIRMQAKRLKNKARPYGIILDVRTGVGVD